MALNRKREMWSTQRKESRWRGRKEGKEKDKQQKNEGWEENFHCKS